MESWVLNEGLGLNGVSIECLKRGERRGDEREEMRGGGLSGKR